MVFDAHGMSFPCTELLLFDYAKVNIHSVAPLNEFLLHDGVLYLCMAWYAPSMHNLLQLVEKLLVMNFDSACAWLSHYRLCFLIVVSVL